MAQLNTKIKLYAAANGVANIDFRTDVMLQDDSNGAGVYIKEWNLDIAKPTDTQIASYETAGNTVETNNVVIATRKAAYGSWETQLEEIYDDGIDSWKTRIAQVKTDNPKSE
jgi:hypothetical protein